jgi:serine/threonine protein phosphatase 1
MATYCVSDIHGHLYEFMSLLGLIDFDAGRDVMYFLGDAVDRGKYPVETLDFIRRTKGIHMLMGNHEKMMVDYYDKGKPKRDNWFRNGCETTIEQLEKLPKEKRDKLFAYVRGLPYYKTVSVGGRRYFLSHAGLDVSLPFSRQPRDALIWSREDFYYHPALKDYVCVFGHTPSMYLHRGNDNCSVWLCKTHVDKINIDCGCAYGGALSALRLDDGGLFYVNSTDKPPHGLRADYRLTAVPECYLDKDKTAYAALRTTSHETYP